MKHEGLLEEDKCDYHELELMFETSSSSARVVTTKLEENSVDQFKKLEAL